MSTVFGVLREGYRDLSGHEQQIIDDRSYVNSIDGYEDIDPDDIIDYAFERVAFSSNSGAYWFESPIAYLLPDSTPVFALDNASDIKTIGEIRNLIDMQ